MRQVSKTNGNIVEIFQSAAKPAASYVNAVKI